MVYCSISSLFAKKKTSEGHAIPEKKVEKDRPPAAGEAGSLPAASPPNEDDNSTDSGLDGKPKKGIIFEIHSEDGFHIRCESIEGQPKEANLTSALCKYVSL